MQRYFFCYCSWIWNIWNFMLGIKLSWASSWICLYQSLILFKLANRTICYGYCYFVVCCCYAIHKGTIHSGCLCCAEQEHRFDNEGVSPVCIQKTNPKRTGGFNHKRHCGQQLIVCNQCSSFIMFPLLANLSSCRLNHEDRV